MLCGQGGGESGRWPNEWSASATTDDSKAITHFLMDAENGQLKLSRAFEPDLSNAEYQVVVLARGSAAGSPSLRRYQTVVNRAMPVFDKAFYSVRVNEDVPVLTPILGINASCPEGQAALEAPALPSGGLIPRHHAITIIGNHPPASLCCPATAAVTGARSEVEVEVVVGDVNDNPPTFTSPTHHAVISENAMIGTPVIQVQAVDLDSDKNGAVRYQLLPGGAPGAW
ncbi:hypothetical protein AALO_G00207150 [Alosa alosa]|uniref:Cadherin domain-containing protein n=1 Tax=Alosa alosa TaxID=278164 RepID=A0AAV6G430_9TELE|nr:hypothetical protein AALO_G00207150 [Alosa alosa]